MSLIIKNDIMKGLIVELNGDKKIFGPPSDEGVMTFIISIGKNEKQFRIDAGGYDPKKDIHYDWIKTMLPADASISIKLLESIEQEKFSEPINKRFADSNNLINKKKLEYYFSLKKELEDKGLL